tara:strand:- start:14049 stop:14438 length:390 start_codon:yes stop_codon:yes gene_type:complete
MSYRNVITNNVKYNLIKYFNKQIPVIYNVEKRYYSNKEVENINLSYDNLKRQYHSLDSKYKTLKKEKEDSYTKYYTIKNEYDNLLEKYNSIKEDFDIIVSNNSELKRDIDHYNIMLLCMTSLYVMVSFR